MRSLRRFFECGLLRTLRFLPRRFLCSLLYGGFVTTIFLRPDILTAEESSIVGSYRERT